ncbi:MAG: DUF4893 domain-containing protein [Rhizomicrobium sp.]
MRTLALLLVALFASSSAFAGWQEDASSAEADRLNHLPQIREAAIAAAKTGEGRGDWRVISRVMEPQARSIPVQALTGNWRCRQIKLGGMSSYMVYDRWFTCSIRARNGGLVLEKTGGSQRFAGWLYPEQGAWVYLGASHVRGEPRHNYSGPSPALGAQVTPDDQIGLLTGIGDNHLRLEIPAVQESLLDVVEFAR